MSRTTTYTQQDIERAEELRDNHENDRGYRAALVFLCVCEGFTVEQAAKIFNIGVRTVFEDMDRIRKPETAEKGQWGGSRNRLMTPDEEEEFLAEYYDEAIQGFVLTMPEMHAEFNKRVGKETPKSTFYRILKKHTWRKVLPDTRHPKGDPKVQEEFKKKHSKFRWERR